MSASVRVVAGVLMLAHGLIHLLYAAPAPDDPSFPLTFESSWLIPAGARRPLGPALMAATAALFALLALAVWGVPGLAAIWPAHSPYW